MARPDPREGGGRYLEIIWPDNAFINFLVLTTLCILVLCLWYKYQLQEGKDGKGDDH